LRQLPHEIESLLHILDVMNQAIALCKIKNLQGGLFFFDISLLFIFIFIEKHNLKHIYRYKLQIIIINLHVSQVSINWFDR
jgi:hypothetical protein